MYVRDAKNRDEAWLLEWIEQMGLDDAAFRSRDYVIAVDEESNERAGFGRLRKHKGEDEEHLELTGIGVLPSWRGHGVGAHVVERLVDTAAADGFESVYVFTDEADYLTQFGFERIDDDTLPTPLRDRLGKKRETVAEDVVALRIHVEEFGMADRLRRAFKRASEGADDDGEDATESAEDFGIDPETATYKYDTGR